MIFVNASVANSRFTSQSKTELTTKPSEYTTSAKVSDKFKKGIYSSSITELSIGRILGVG